ncbi:hypothetical protein C2845_PM07G31100 [Panicum miliaceum]|uniref:Leucine-rich repeat-containing N-terminal plant-type domain-containing protein n=1 Tax=Panicum miliaceum TaxID=4540 RepID=A0A3L6SGI6_PANMI|nr:hypothetical protein C2845_PM07G31100 [Panicum miliaceum]
MSCMLCGIRFLLWFLLLSSGSSFCSGSELDVRCLKTVQRSVIDHRGLLKSSWNFSSFICSFTGVECWHPDEERVLSLRLSNMGLEGQFPQGLEHCTSLVTLDLSSNNFSGPIPFDIARQLPYLSSLDLSDNVFSGEIPPGISNMVYLNSLYLRRNQLSGRIPGEFGVLDRLTSFDVAYNLLSGPIPAALQKFPASTFAGNPELCDAPLDECPRETKRRLMIHDESVIGAAAGFVVGFVAAFSLAHVFVFPKKPHRPDFFLRI